jgi:2-amino-4-hydroxy-6-hydroxymethyldihydropteridine diphosphokinase
MAFVSVYLGLGSNRGNRLQNLMQALDLLDQGLGCHYTALSHVIETKAWGFKGDKFLNACVLYRIFRKGTPEEHGHEILALCKDIERKLGRDDAPAFDAEGRRIYHNRTIDIDILFYGNERIDCEDLQVPHPLIAERDFVKIPLAEIAKPSLKEAYFELFAQ